MRGRFLAGALAFAVLTGVAATAFAAEGHGGGGMPQLDATKFAPQLVWLAISFVVLYVLMAKVALPRVSAVLETRSGRISEDLRRAEEARGEAEAVMQAYEKALAEARTKAMAEAKAATDVITAQADARQKEAEAGLARQLAGSEAEIQAAKSAAMANVRTVAAEVAVDATRRVGGFDVDPARARAAVDAVLGG